ncbi:hypothetical protein BD626DRAFT_570581 [Schizophyllum amplum]|uniref:Uncharacterized protein n=1 Tax=Schizophyllum amplum TaxID=97359 RepID=A0A550CAQ3_9AGAR|nr:hypothetical protein BD626DRAFT_570581 [Auriculariopsis ampla]
MESMPVSPTFLRIRVIAFSLIAFLSFLWAILYTLDMYWLFDTMGAPERILISLMLLNSSATCIILLVLITREFRPWLDVARVLLLFATHICSAVGYTIWFPTYSCPGTEPASMCRMFNVYILAINWLDIVLLIIYAWGLTTLMVIRRRAAKQAHLDIPEEKFEIDAPDAVEIGRGSLIHTIRDSPARTSQTPSTSSSFYPAPQTASPYQSRHNSTQSSRTQTSRTHSRTLTMSPIVEEPRVPEPAVGKPDLSPRSSARLSKARQSFM